MTVALHLATQGFAVFPCLQDKAPACANGHKDATREPDAIRALWKASPGARIGIWPAMCDPPMVVLDVDVKDPSKDGMGSLRDLRSITPDTLWAETPSGGLHLYYRIPRECDPIGNHELAPGIDLRSANGYVIWYGAEGALADAPPALIARCIKTAAPVRKVEHEVELDQPGNIKIAGEWLAVQPAGSTSGRDEVDYGEKTFAAAAGLRDRGVSEEVALELMIEHYNPRCDPPRDGATSDDATWTLIGHAYQYAQNDPGCRTAEVTYADVIKQLADDIGIPITEQNQGVNRSTFKTWGVTELRAQPGPQPLIKRVLYRQSLTMIVGPYSQFKSFLAIDQAMHLALGWDWMGQKTPAPVDVLLIAAEGGQGIGNRLGAWATHHKVEDPERLRCIIDPYLLMEDCGKLELTLAELAQEDFHPAVIYVDTFAAATAGLNENSSEISMPIHVCRRLSVKYGCAIVLIDHTAKKDDKGEGGARGWSGKGGAADAVYLVSGKNLVADLVVSKPPKDGRPPKPGSFQGHEITLGKDTDNEPITSLAFAWVKDRTPAKLRAAEEERAECALRRKAFLAVVGVHELGRGTIAQSMAHELAGSNVTEVGMTRLQGLCDTWLGNVVRPNSRMDAPEVRDWAYKKGGKWCWSRPES